MCAIDGLVELHMVPHVNRQEVYGGKRMNESAYDEVMYGYPATDAE